MSDTLRRARPVPCLVLAALIGAAGCGDDLQLPPANVPIAQQVILLSALSGTPVTTPSAYNMLGLAEVRTDLSNDFDFVFDLGPDSSYGLGTTGDTIAVLIPRGYLGFAADGGLIWTLAGFDSVRIAPVTGYLTDKPTRIRAGDVVIAASRIQTCEFSFLRPRYAKIQIISIDLTTRQSQMRVVIDPNCGYRSLGSGIPTQ